MSSKRACRQTSVLCPTSDISPLWTIRRLNPKNRSLIGIHFYWIWQIVSVNFSCVEQGYPKPPPSDALWTSGEKASNCTGGKRSRVGAGVTALKRSMRELSETTGDIALTGVLENPVRRMLIVDENHADREIVGRLFENSGIKMEWVSGGTAALGMMHRGYDLVMTTLSTADMDGVELLLRIKQVDAAVEVIIVGTDRSEETVARVMRHDAFCYLTKPYSDTEPMVRAVRRALDRRRETSREEALYRALLTGEMSVVEVDGGTFEIPFTGTGVPVTDLVSMMSDGFVFLNAEGRISFANVKFSRKLNFPYRSILGKQFVKYVLREERAPFEEFLAHIRESRIGVHETRMVNRTGRIIHILITCRRLDTAALPEQTLLVVTDITDKRRAEERARMLATLLDRARFEAILVYDEQGRILHFNEAALEMFGYSHYRLSGMHLTGLFQNDDPTAALPFGGTHEEGSRELLGLRSDGTVFPVEVSESLDSGGEEGTVGLLFARDIAKRKAAEVKLVQANEQLKAMNETLISVREAQRSFFANMSHELKTPLNTIGGYAGLMLDGVGGALGERHLKWMESIKRQSGQLLMIIQEILEFAKMDKQEAALSFKPMRPEVAVQEIAAVGAALVGRRPVQVTAETAPDLPVVVTDPYRLRQVLINLVSNAVKFTPQGEVRIGVRNAPSETVMFYVEDTGIGIEAAELPKIFDDFYQVAPKNDENAGGSGLGLAIVRRHVERLNGTVQVSSEPGNGTKFNVIIPISPEPFTGSQPPERA